MAAREQAHRGWAAQVVQHHVYGGRPNALTTALLLRHAAGDMYARVTPGCDRRPGARGRDMGQQGARVVQVAPGALLCAAMPWMVRRDGAHVAICGGDGLNEW